MTKKALVRVTLSDVARKVGVAPSTVSYILRRVEPHFSRYAKATIARVEQAAMEAGYAPNLLATSLRQRHAPYFGIFFEFVRPGDTGPSGGLSTMMWEVYEGIAATARKDRRYPVVLTSPNPSERLADSPEELDLLVRSGLAGVIAAVHPQTWSNHIERWEASGVPCISVFDAGDEEHPRWCVDLDNQAVGRIAWEYLARHGHRQVICICQRPQSQAVIDRMAAFRSAQQQSGAPPIIELSWCRDPLGRVPPEEQRLILDTLRDSRATAIFGADGGSSVVTHEILAANHIGVPEQCSLIGIDLPVWSGPAHVVTQVACSGVTVGQEAANLLLRRIHGEDAEIRCVLVPPVVEERTSVARL